MFNVGGGEIFVILILALIVLGPDKLPHAARQAGKYLNEFRRMSNGFQQEIRSAMDLDGSHSATSHPASPPSSDTTGPALPPLDVTTSTVEPTTVATEGGPVTAERPPTEAPAAPRGIVVDGPDSSFN